MKANNWDFVLIESDYFRVVQAIHYDIDNQSHFDMLVLDCISLSVTLFDVRVVFVKRSTNMAAHSLARAAYYIYE